MSLLEIKIFFMLIGIILGFIITWSFVGHRFWGYKYFKEEHNRIYNDYYKLNKYACEAYWILRHNYFKDNEYRTIDDAFFALDHYYGDDYE